MGSEMCIRDRCSTNTNRPSSSKLKVNPDNGSQGRTGFWARARALASRRRGSGRNGADSSRDHMSADAGRQRRGGLLRRLRRLCRRGQPEDM